MGVAINGGIAAVVRVTSEAKRLVGTGIETWQAAVLRRVELYVCILDLQLRLADLYVVLHCIIYTLTQRPFLLGASRQDEGGGGHG